MGELVFSLIELDNNHLKQHVLPGMQGTVVGAGSEPGHVAVDQCFYSPTDRKKIPALRAADFWSWVKKLKNTGTGSEPRDPLDDRHL